MPSLNLRNVLRRNPDRPSLRQRAAALKAAAAKAIRRPNPEDAAGAAPAETWEFLDTILLSLVRELSAIEASQNETLAAAGAADACDCPDWVRLERDRKRVLARIVSTQAHTMEGVRAKVSLLDLCSVRSFQQPFDDLSRSIEADAARLGATAPTVPPAPSPADPHVALLPALRQAFAWTRESHPFGDKPANSPEGRAHDAVLGHCWDLARHMVMDLPPPTTLAGLGALALALSVYAEEIIGRPLEDGLDVQRHPEEWRLVAATRAMMSVAGVEPLPGWTGFEVGPDSDARWEAVKARAGKGSAPAWALAGKSGPDDASEA
ncbi:hypothetical protein [Methylobacterium ajmalii]|uniref:hypothetical protein n=1 Tax=Methylobacterium ajmalii TaxID=2738439 RepID=UPI0019094B22|nr:hypothetical protein [Methylobacterium ajmalii]MBK3400052.1 hypothetical protein [Methylobacterium ajmalii]MBK3411347.1 hypothetical protein [Methylobacterium ajmalii]MBK3426711.1 hypothetical protein [Methylobacterium ajmalii]